MSAVYKNKQESLSDREADSLHQSKKRFQATGIPSEMQQRFENLSGFSYDDVRVHYNSEKPARLDASAFTQGNEVHIGPGQDHYLEHELGHVAQQKQGVVRPTGEIEGHRVNDNPVLERQADSMRDSSPAPGYSGGELSVGAGSYSAGAPVQMAGHAGVMIFSKDGKLAKRVEKNEYEEYVRVWLLQLGYENNGASASREEQLASSVFPKVYMAFGGKPHKSALTGEYTQEKLDAWAEKHQDNEDYYVEIESIGGENLEIKDFKVGTTSVSYMDLTKHHGKSASAASKKVGKMRKRDDKLTETAKYGLRDSDETQNKLPAIGRAMGRFHNTLDRFTEQIEAMGGFAGGANQVFSTVLSDLYQIEHFIEQSDTVYVASSVILSFDKSGGNERARAKLIDLAHPIRKDEPGFEDEFEEIKEGMLLGIRNISNTIMQKPMAKAKKKTKYFSNTENDGGWTRTVQRNYMKRLPNTDGLDEGEQAYADARVSGVFVPTPIHVDADLYEDRDSMKERYKRSVALQHPLYSKNRKRNLVRKQVAERRQKNQKILTQNRVLSPNSMEHESIIGEKERYKNKLWIEVYKKHPFYTSNMKRKWVEKRMDEYNEKNPSDAVEWGTVHAPQPLTDQERKAYRGN